MREEYRWTNHEGEVIVGEIDHEVKTIYMPCSPEKFGVGKPSHLFPQQMPAIVASIGFYYYLEFAEGEDWSGLYGVRGE